MYLTVESSLKDVNVCARSAVEGEGALLSLFRCPTEWHHNISSKCASQNTGNTHHAQNTGHFCFHALQPLLLNVSNILSHPCENWPTWVRIYPHVHPSHQTHHNQQGTFGQFISAGSLLCEEHFLILQFNVPVIEFHVKYLDLHDED